MTRYETERQRRVLPRDAAMHPRYYSHGPVSSSICLCLSVTSRGVLLKRLNVESRKQHHTNVVSRAHQHCASPRPGFKTKSDLMLLQWRRVDKAKGRARPPPAPLPLPLPFPPPHFPSFLPLPLGPLLLLPSTPILFLRSRLS